MYTYPEAFLDATTAEALAFLKSPALLARRFTEIVAARGFLAHKVLASRYTMVGGALVYLPDESIEADESPEQIAPGGEYPMITLSPDQVEIVQAMKRGFGTEVTDEAVGRLQMDPIERALAMLANKQISEFDELSMSLVASSITQSVTGGAWTTGKQIVADTAKAKAKLTSHKLGYRADAVILTDDQWALVGAPLLEVLPREAANPVLSGDFPNFMGLTWLHSADLPSGWVPTVVDTRSLGGIGHENIPSPEYVSRSVGDATSVEIARYREKNDSTRVQVRKTDVPVVRNPKAGVEITGTGL